MNVMNYQKVLDCEIQKILSGDKTPRLLLHSCCAPCSSYCLEYLSQYFDITVYFYNPNISRKEEYDKRAEELKRLVSELPAKHQIQVVIGAQEPDKFYEIAKGLEKVPEGGERCFKCYRLRLEEAAKMAAEGYYDYFTTTLSISPLKNAAKLNEIGAELADIYGVPYLFSDFKKKNGYKRSIELSAIYGLYRQNYCGCIYSEQEMHERLKKAAQSENDTGK